MILCFMHHRATIEQSWHISTRIHHENLNLLPMHREVVPVLMSQSVNVSECGLSLVLSIYIIFDSTGIAIASWNFSMTSNTTYDLLLLVNYVLLLILGWTRTVVIRYAPESKIILFLGMGLIFDSTHLYSIQCWTWTRLSMDILFLWLVERMIDMIRFFLSVWNRFTVRWWNSSWRIYWIHLYASFVKSWNGQHWWLFWLFSFWLVEEKRSLKWHRLVSSRSFISVVIVYIGWCHRNQFRSILWQSTW